MVQKDKKSLFSFLIIFALLFILLYFFFLLTQKEAESATVHFFNVGQGDAILLDTPKKQRVLIDGGPDKTILSKLDGVLPFYSRRIDAVILTHPHNDHLVGLIEVLKDYRVGAFYSTRVENNTSEYAELIKVIAQKKIPHHYLSKDDVIKLQEGIKIDFIYPSEDLKTENLNSTSVVCKLSWGEAEILLTGDLGAGVHDLILPGDIEAEVLKVPHHCSNDALDSRLIFAVKPKYSVIMVGRDNKFGHPTKACLNYLKETEVYRTDRDGDIIFQLSFDSIVPLN